MITTSGIPMSLSFLFISFSHSHSWNIFLDFFLHCMLKNSQKYFED